MTRDRFPSLVPASFVRAAVLALIALLALATRPAAAAPLADSTTVERWTLANGLRVVARQIPRAQDVALTVGYRFGMDDDPSDHPGLAQVIGDLGFTAATADQPARTVADLDRQLPLGWSDPVVRHLTLFTESVPRDRLRDLLSRNASRMRGVQFDAAALDAAVHRVKRELGQEFFGEPVQSLPFELREVGLGATDAQMLQRASGAGLTGLTVEQVRAELGRAFVPANAVLSLAGDLRGVDLHAEIQRLYGAIPAGSAHADAAERVLTPVQRTIRRHGEPAAILGVLSPALSDSTHPTFYMAALLFGGMADQTWSGSSGPHRALLQYGVFDEPELVRLAVPVRPRESDFTVLQKRVYDVANTVRGAVIPGDSYAEMRASVSWLMGGAMTPAQRAAVRTSRPALMLLTRSQASCELRHGPAFWQRYLRRLMDVRPGQPESWMPWFTDPKRQVFLLSLPSAP